MKQGAKTLFILRYLGSEAYRRRIGVQLNEGEALHALRRFLFFAHQGRKSVSVAKVRGPRRAGDRPAGSGRK